ncbi:hypothetical protein Ahia01_000853000, partial [Argonauta hians]
HTISLSLSHTLSQILSHCFYIPEMKVALLFLVLIPLVFSATIPDEDIDKKLSVFDIIKHIRDLDLSGGCEQACENNVEKFWTFLCSAACRILLAGGGGN